MDCLCLMPAHNHHHRPVHMWIEMWSCLLVTVTVVTVVTVVVVVDVFIVAAVVAVVSFPLSSAHFAFVACHNLH